MDIAQELIDFIAPDPNHTTDDDISGRAMLLLFQSASKWRTDHPDQHATIKVVRHDDDSLEVVITPT